MYLLKIYAALKENRKDYSLEKIMKDNGLKYSAAIHNASYHLLGHDVELGYSRINPINLPGIDTIEKKDKGYLMHTKIGTIKVYKASEIFKYHKSSDLFGRPLAGQCYARTYDFVKMNPSSSTTVLAYMPNHLYGSHFHAYVEREDDIIDIAANAYYESKEDAKNILTGEVLARYSFEEIEEIYKQFEKANEKGTYKLKVLTAHKFLNLI